MVQLNSNSNVILPSWMPFISKVHQLILTTDECTNESIPYENENNDILFIVKNFLNTVAFSDNLMSNYLKDQLGNETKTKTIKLKNDIIKKFWNWTLEICWFIRNNYLEKNDLNAIINCENEIIKDNHNNNGIIHLSTPELTPLINGNNYPLDESLKEESEFVVLLDILNLHQNLCLELSNIEKDINIENEKNIFFLWWFLSYNLLKIFNKKFFIYGEKEFDKMMEEIVLNDTTYSINVIYATHSGFNYFSEDILSFSKYYLQSLENNVLLLFQEGNEEEGESDCKYQQDLLNIVFANNVKCIPMTFSSFSSMMQESTSFKEKKILESIKAAKSITEFTITKQLGKGSSGFVRNAIHIETGRKVIIKYVVKSLILRGCWTSNNDNSYTKFPNEIAVLQYIYDQYNGDVPNNLTTLITYWEDSTYYYLVFADTAEFDSDLFDYIDKTPNRIMTDNEAKTIFRNIAKAIQILHHNNIVHRDIKDENVLINTKTREIQLIDFGSSSFYNNNQKLRNFVGSFFICCTRNC